MVGKGAVKRHALGGVGPPDDVISVGHDIRMQKEQIEPRQSQSFQTALDRPTQYPFDLLRGLFAKIAFAGHSHTRGETAAKCLAHHFFCFAVAIARRKIEEINTRSDRVMYGRNAFVEGRRSPQHAKPAASQGKRRDWRQTAKGVRLHSRLLSCAALWRR